MLTLFLFTWSTPYTSNMAACYEPRVCADTLTLTHVCGSRVASLSQTAHRVSTFRKNIYIHSYDFQPSGFTWAVNHCRCWWTLKLKTPSNVEIPVSVASILGRSRSFLSWAIAAGLRQSGPGPKNRGPPSKPFVFLHFLKFPSYNL